MLRVGGAALRGIRVGYWRQESSATARSTGTALQTAKMVTGSTLLVGELARRARQPARSWTNAGPALTMRTRSAGTGYALVMLARQSEQKAPAKTTTTAAAAAAMTGSWHQWLGGGAAAAMPLQTCRYQQRMYSRLATDPSACLSEDMHLSGTVVLQPRVRLRDGRANVPFAGDAAGGRASLPSFTQRSLHEPDEQLAEAKALVTCIPGWHVVGERIVPVRAVEGSTYFGKGRLSELAEWIDSFGPHCDNVVINTLHLSPLQEERLTVEFGGRQVWDRFGLILEIFQQRATTLEAKLQVELARIPYERAKLPHKLAGSHDRERGGTHTVGGKGESPLELERRLLDERARKIRAKLSKSKEQHDIAAASRKRSNIPTVALVGYTNAGKTSLMRALTNDGNIEPQDQLFATLDSTVRRVVLPRGTKINLIDTIGFIADLPPMLVSAFQHTLDDVTSADMVVHVHDGTAREPVAQNSDVAEVLAGLCSEDSLQHTVHVITKTDIMNDAQVMMTEELREQLAGPVAMVSTRTMAGCSDLLQLLEDHVLQLTGSKMHVVRIPSTDDGQQLTWLYRHASVLDMAVSDDDDGATAVTVIFDDLARRRFLAQWPEHDNVCADDEKIPDN